MMDTYPSYGSVSNFGVLLPSGRAGDADALAASSTPGGATERYKPLVFHDLEMENPIRLDICWFPGL